MEAIIVIDSDEEANEQATTLSNGNKNKSANLKRKHEKSDKTDNEHKKSKIRRITPKKVADLHEISDKPSTSAGIFDNIDDVLDLSLAMQEELPDVDLLVPQDASDINESTNKNSNNNQNGHSSNNEPSTEEKTEINQTFQALLDACRKAEQSDVMEKILNNKLIRYYHSVHPDFVNSKTFCKTVKTTTSEILKEPKFVYIKLKNIVDELNVCRKSKQIVISNDKDIVNGERAEKKEKQLKKLNKALWTLKKRIQTLEEAEVDLMNGNDEYSDYVRLEKYQKRACQIYDKICDITGQSKHALRETKKPISFKGTPYEHFNKLLQKFVNKNNEFPDYYDVLRLLDYCDKKHELKLRKEEKEKIAQDAFEKVGKLLQKRRKTDLYDTATYFVGVDRQPELNDEELRVKLEQNKKLHKNINDIIDRYAEKQDIEKIEKREKDEGTSSSTKDDEKLNTNNNEKSSTTKNQTEDSIKSDADISNQSKKEEPKIEEKSKLEVNENRSAIDSDPDDDVICLS